MNIIRTKAIVLLRTNYGEADRILQLLTPSGKISVMAYGARREKSKVSGGIELFSICDVVVNEGKGSLSILSSAKLIRFFNYILEDYDRLQFGYSAIKLVSGACEMVNEPEWYEILVEVFEALDGPLVPLGLISSWLYMQYSGLLGYELSLWHDNLGEKLVLGANYRYDSDEKCIVLADNGELTTEHIKLLRLISTRPLKTLAQIGGIDKILPVCLSVATEHAAIK